jgi:hypothetical protein
MQSHEYWLMEEEQESIGSSIPRVEARELGFFEYMIEFGKALFAAVLGFNDSEIKERN